MWTRSLMRFFFLFVGSYLRTRSLDLVAENFIKSGSMRLDGVESGSAQASVQTKKQIVSLGCGSDTRYFKLKVKPPRIL